MNCSFTPPNIRIQPARDSEGFPRYNAYATVNGTEEMITCESLSEDLDRDINDWLHTFNQSALSKRNPGAVEAPAGELARVSNN